VSLRLGRTFIDLLAEDRQRDASEGALHSKGERSTAAGAALSPICSPCVASGSLGEEIDGIARDDEVVVVLKSALPSVQVPPIGVSGLAEPGTVATVAAAGVSLVWFGIESFPQPGPRSVPVVPQPEDPHPFVCVSPDADACSPQAEGPFDHPSDALASLLAPEPQPEPPALVSPRPLDPDVPQPLWCDDAPRVLDVAEE
jgi:hypothetical protein